MAGSGLTGFLQNFGGGEILLIVLAALVILGPDRLPEAGRSIGRAIHKVRSMSSGVESQVRDVIDDPAMQSIRELGEFAARPRQKLAQYALEAEAEARAGSQPAPPDPMPTPADESARTTSADVGAVEPVTDPAGDAGDAAPDGPPTSEPESV